MRGRLFGTRLSRGVLDGFRLGSERKENALELCMRPRNKERRRLHARAAARCEELGQKQRVRLKSIRSIADAALSKRDWTAH